MWREAIVWNVQGTCQSCGTTSEEFQINLFHQLVKKPDDWGVYGEHLLCGDCRKKPGMVPDYGPLPEEEFKLRSHLVQMLMKVSSLMTFAGRTRMVKKAGYEGVCMSRSENSGGADLSMMIQGLEAADGVEALVRVIEVVREDHKGSFLGDRLEEIKQRLLEND